MLINISGGLIFTFPEISGNISLKKQCLNWDARVERNYLGNRHSGHRAGHRPVLRVRQVHGNV